MTQSKKFPLHPAHPERICWGCSRYCPADAMRCGNGAERTQHPCELLGDDWMAFGIDAEAGNACEGSQAACLAHKHCATDS